MTSVVLAGAPVSTVNGQMPVWALSVPTLLVAVAVMLCRPSASLSVVMVQLPEASVAPLPITRPLLSYSLTVLPGCAVPLKVGWLSSVTAPFCRKPTYGPTSSYTLTMAGAAGAPTSTVTLYGALGTVALPAGSVSTAVSALRPETSGSSGLSDQVPSAPTVALPITWLPVLSLV